VFHGKIIDWWASSDAQELAGGGVSAGHVAPMANPSKPASATTNPRRARRGLPRFKLDTKSWSLGGQDAPVSALRSPTVSPTARGPLKMRA